MPFVMSAHTKRVIIDKTLANELITVRICRESVVRFKYTGCIMRFSPVCGDESWCYVEQKM